MKKDKLEKVRILVLFIIIVFRGFYIKTGQENKQENVIANNKSLLEKDK